MVIVNGEGQRVRVKEKWKRWVSMKPCEVMRDGHGDKVGLKTIDHNEAWIFDGQDGWYASDII